MLTCSPALGKRRQEDQKVKVILHYIVSSKLVWATLDPVSKKQTKMPAPPQTNWHIFVFSHFHKDCDQIHVDDVSSDDNGQDLR